MTPTSSKSRGALGDSGRQRQTFPVTNRQESTLMTTTETTLPRLGMSIAEFCNRAGFSERHFFRLDARGEAPKTVRVGRRRLILEETAQAWLRALEA